MNRECVRERGDNHALVVDASAAAFTAAYDAIAR